MKRNLNVNTTRNIGLAAALAASLLLSACFGGGDDDDAIAGSQLEVPESAGTSGTAFVGYIQGLGAGDETSEPLMIKDAFAVPPSDDTEPSPVG